MPHGIGLYCCRGGTLLMVAGRGLVSSSPYTSLFKNILVSDNSNCYTKEKASGGDVTWKKRFGGIFV